MDKPTGISGHFHVGADAGGEVRSGFVQIPFPKTKAAVELKVAERFIGSLNSNQPAHERLLWAPRPNEENSLDFTVTTRRGEADLELMEVAVLDGPHRSAPAEYRPYDLAQAVLSRVLKKSSAYGPRRERDRFLLLYPTHWAFAFSHSAMLCLICWLNRTGVNFSAVFYYQPLTAEEGVPYGLFPVPPEILGTFDPESVRENVVLNLDPQGWTADA